MKYNLLLISIILFISCKRKKHLQQEDGGYVSKTIKNIVKENNTHKINSDTIDVASLPLGNSFTTFNFPTLVPTIDQDDNNITTATTIKIDSILKTAYHFAETKPIIKFNSDKEIKHTQYLLRAFPDRKSKTFENIYQLPNKYGFNIYIERVSTINNKHNNTNILYSLAIYKGDTIRNRYCIGYDYYGDLVESYKVWQINKKFILNTRTITNVAGNNETYISELDKFTITDTGDLVKYFEEKEHNFKNSKESGKIENHLKEGIWVEVKDFDGYINQESYLEAQYKKGIPIGLWKYFTLETVEETNDEGYVTNSYTKKGNKLLMTESYNAKGKLLKREVLKEEKIKIDLILKDSIGVKLENNKIVLNKEKWKNLGYEKMEKFNQDFDYSIIGKIKCKSGEILLIERDYVEESIHWLILTKIDNTISFIESAYENSEGFSTIKSEIFFDKIIIKEWNTYSENEYKEEVYYLTKKEFVKRVH